MKELRNQIKLISKHSISKVQVINLKVTFERWLNNDFKLSRD